MILISTGELEIMSIFSSELATYPHLCSLRTVSQDVVKKSELKRDLQETVSRGSSPNPVIYINSIPNYGKRLKKQSGF